MKIDIFTLCDNAQQYEGGKLVIVGTFNNVNAKKYPIYLSSMALVARIVFDKTEAGTHKIEYSIKKSDSEVCILPVNIMEAKIASGDGENVVVNLIVNGNNILIPSEGTYNVTLKIDKEMFETSFTARLKN